jgi:hypothetical protein
MESIIFGIFIKLKPVTIGNIFQVLTYFTGVGTQTIFNTMKVILIMVFSVVMRS